MIVTKIIGGLGNQMFQYAAGEALAQHLGVEHKLDISDYIYFDDRQFDLECFKLKYNSCSKTELLKFRLRDKFPFSKAPKITLSIEKKLNIQHYFDRTTGFQHDFFDLKGNIYLNGYWQSEKYFQPIINKIRKDFTFIPISNSKNREILKKINSTDSISLHIRRGDYVQKAKTNAFHGVCSLDYYQAAVKRLLKNVKKPHIFVFSDDPNWVKENLKTGYPTVYVDHNQDQPFEDMRLMSLCKHNIIANSTFSWWGAWLNTNSKKIVIAPDPWFSVKEQNNPDLLPKEWIKLKK